MAHNELSVPSYALHKIPAAARVKHSSSAVTEPIPYINSQSIGSSVTSTHLNPYTVNSETLLADYIDSEDSEENPEYRLPSIMSLIVVMAGNALSQLSFFAVVPAAHIHVEKLGGTSTFAGLIIGVPTVITGLALPIVKKFDGGRYRHPFIVAYIASVVGNILFALAYYFKVLYLLLIARMVAGIGFTSFMYSRKYCTDPRLVGIRRRTALASWYIFGQAFGFSAGPWIGGIFYELGLGKSSLFNGLTAPGWIISGVWLVFWGFSICFFQDVPKTPLDTMRSRPAIGEQDMHTTASNIANDQPPNFHLLTFREKRLLVCVCYYSIAFFFIISGWESNIPILTEYTWGYSPQQSGRFIAIGAGATFPFLLLNVRYSYRIEDRLILVTGTLLGLLGLIIHLSSWLITRTVHFWPLLIAWFLLALGFNLASTCTISLVSKQMPVAWNEKVSMAIQYSNYTGRAAGAVMGGAGVKIGMEKYLGIQIAVVGLGVFMHLFLWTERLRTD